MDVAHFFEFEGSFERHRKLIAAPEIKEVVRLTVLQCEFMEDIIQLDDVLDLLRELAESVILGVGSPAKLNQL